MQRLFGRGQRRCVAIMTKKKTIILCFAVAAAICGISGYAVSSVRSDQMTGDWYLVSVANGDENINPADLDAEIHLNLSKNKTWDIQWAEGDSDTGEYKRTGETITLDNISAYPEKESDKNTDNRMSFILKDGNLINEEYGLTFSREKPVIHDWEKEIGTSRDNVTLKDFQGTWNIYAVKFLDSYMYSQEAGLTGTLTVQEDGSASFSMEDLDAEITYMMSGKLAGNQLILKKNEDTNASDSLDAAKNTYIHPELLTLSLTDTGILEDVDAENDGTNSGNAKTDTFVYFKK